MSKMAKAFTAISLVMCLIMASVTVFAESKVSVYAYFNKVKLVVNGQETSTPTLLYGGRTYLQLKATAEIFGALLDWDGDTNTVTVGAATSATNTTSTTSTTSETVKLSDLDYFTKDGRDFKSSDQVRINTGDYLNDCLYLDMGVYSGTMDYLINGAYTKISGTIYLDYESRASIANGYTFNIWGDGKLLYTSDDIKAGFLPKSFEVDISGVNDLKIGFEQINFTYTECLCGISNTLLTKK